MNKTLWLSIGENCMTSDLLRRFDLFAPSTIYSHARCSINHVLQIETINYKDLLDKKFLFSGTTHGGVNCVFSSLIKDGDLSFEFTHLNPLKITNKTLLESRIERMLESRDSEARKVFCYNHRSANGFEAPIKQELLLAINTLSKLYNNSVFFFFTQKVIQDPAERSFLVEYAENYAFAELKSLKKWEGAKDIYGRCDDDLFKDILIKVKKHFSIKD